MLQCAHRESRDEDFTFTPDRLSHHADEFIHSLTERSVVPVAIGGFEEDDIGSVKRFEIAQDRKAHRSQIAGEDNTLAAGLPESLHFE